MSRVVRVIGPVNPELMKYKKSFAIATHAAAGPAYARDPATPDVVRSKIVIPPDAIIARCLPSLAMESRYTLTGSPYNSLGLRGSEKSITRSPNGLPARV